MVKESRVLFLKGLRVWVLFSPTKTSVFCRVPVNSRLGLIFGPYKTGTKHYGL